jgi:hypothetical protein
MFELQQGIVSPRDNSINWSTFDTYETIAAAKHEIRNHKGLWRVVESHVVWQSLRTIRQWRFPPPRPRLVGCRGSKGEAK